MTDLPLSLSNILENEDENGYLRPGSMDDDSAFSEDSEYVGPDSLALFIPPDHVSQTDAAGN